MAQQFYYFCIEYFDGKGQPISKMTLQTPLDHWDLCMATWDDMPEGAEDFHLEELAEWPEDVPAVTHEQAAA